MAVTAIAEWHSKLRVCRYGGPHDGGDLAQGSGVLAKKTRSIGAARSGSYLRWLTADDEPLLNLPFQLRSGWCR